jgi:hypothetical protein
MGSSTVSRSTCHDNQARPNLNGVTTPTRHLSNKRVSHELGRTRLALTSGLLDHNVPYIGNWRWDLFCEIGLVYVLAIWLQKCLPPYVRTASSAVRHQVTVRVSASGANRGAHQTTARSAQSARTYPAYMLLTSKNDALYTFSP